MVLPPGNWDRNVLLPILIAQSRAIAVRRKMVKAGKETTVRGRESPFIRPVCLCPLHAVDCEKNFCDFLFCSFAISYINEALVV